MSIGVNRRMFHEASPATISAPKINGTESRVATLTWKNGRKSWRAATA